MAPIFWPDPSVLHLLGGAALITIAACACWYLGWPHDDDSDTARGMR